MTFLKEKKILIILLFFSLLISLMFFTCIAPDANIGMHKETGAANDTTLQRVNSAAFEVEYVITNDWGSGFTADVTIINKTGVKINGWTLAFTFADNQKVVSSWNAGFNQSDRTASFVNESYNAEIPNNSSLSFGFQAEYSGSNTSPTNYVLNGTSNNDGTTSSNASSSSSSVTSQSSSSTAARYNIPGRIEAENYSEMLGIQLVNITSGGTAVGYVDQNDWLKYDVYIEKAGVYRIQYRVASRSDTGIIQFRLDNRALNRVSIPNTGDWNGYTTVTHEVRLTAGNHRISLWALSGPWNLDWFLFTDVSNEYIIPDQPWKDIYGNVINAHSGGIYYENGFYHWYGEHKLDFPESTAKADGGVHLYRSRDLIHWNDLGIVLSVDYNNPNSDIAYTCRLQRPKVVYNSSTRKYVMYFKLYLIGNGVRIGHTGVATADSARGPFTYSHKYLAASQENGSGDFALFKMDNDVYYITVRKSDRVLVKAKLRSDYLYPAENFTAMSGVKVSTEGPAIFYKSGTFHLIGSGSSGWDPNPMRYYTSTSIDGPWIDQGNPCVGTNPISGLGPDKTFGGQSTFINQIMGVENQYIVMMDVWRPETPTQSTYIWLPFRVLNRKITIRWQDFWNLSWFDNN